MRGSTPTMTIATTAISPSIYLIADHLDAVLAHGEDLMAMSSPVDEAPDSKGISHIQQRLTRQREFLEAIRATETRLVTRVLRAREHAEQVRRSDTRFKSITDLLVGGTHVVADASAELADSTALDFNTGRDSIAYLRGRGLIGEGVLSMPRCSDLKITETFRLCGVIELGVLLDLAAAYLDALELHYDLYGNAVSEREAPPKVAASTGSGSEPHAAP